VTIDRGKGRGTDKGVSGRGRYDVNMSVRISILLRDTEIDEVDYVCIVSNADQHISRFQVPVNDVASMNALKATNLNNIHHDRFIKDRSKDLPIDPQPMQ